MADLEERQKRPEFAPLRNFNKSFPIVVVLYNQNDEVVQEHEMDYGNSDDRQWLGKLSFWAWNNGFYVETSKK